MIPERAAVRAATKYAVSNDCWVSTYSVGSHGYAQVGWSNAGVNAATTAHRAAWTYHNGEIPEGMTVDHVCHNRVCVNPNHLRLLSNFENARKNRKGYNPDFCKNGHPRDPQSIGKRRGCHVCNMEKQKLNRVRAKSNYGGN